MLLRTHSSLKNFVAALTRYYFSFQVIIDTNQFIELSLYLNWSIIDEWLETHLSGFLEEIFERYAQVSTIYWEENKGHQKTRLMELIRYKS